MQKKIYIFLLALSCFACGSKNKKIDHEQQDNRPMKPVSAFYSAYDEKGNWALEMDVYGEFHFVDYNNNIDLHCLTGDFSSFTENDKNGLIWTMTTDTEFQIRLKIFEENCFNFGFNKYTMILELFNEVGTLYRIGACGTYHNTLGFGNTYELRKVNQQDYEIVTGISEKLTLSIQKTKFSNMLSGTFNCRTYMSSLNLLENTFSISFNLYPNMDCHEPAETSAFFDKIANRKYYFRFSDQNKILTLSDKFDTFVFYKI